MSAIPCSRCGQFHSADAGFCPVTGEALESRTRSRRARSAWWIALASGVGIVLLGLGLLWLEGRGGTLLAWLPPANPTRQVLADSPSAASPIPAASPPTEATSTPTLPPPSAVLPPTSTLIHVEAAAGPWPACTGAPLSRLRAGDRAYLSYDPPIPSRVRVQAGTHAAISGQIDPGDAVEILEGPVCVGGQVWWKVRAPRAGLTGWTAEGDAAAYWLVPIASSPMNPAPRIFDFLACLQSCNPDGSNATRAVPERTTTIHARWNYENIPPGARYVRSWTMGGREWVKYDCIWPGPERGADSVTLTEPQGLHSGTWEVTIAVNGLVLLREQVVVEGNWTYWSPAGEFAACYGKR